MSRVPGDPLFRPGQQVSATELNRLAELAGRTERMSVGGAGGGQAGPEGITVFVAPDPEWWVMITGQGDPSVADYSWAAVRRTLTFPFGWEIIPEGPNGDYSSQPAVEVNGNKSVPVLSIHRAWLADDGNTLEFITATGGGTGIYTNWNNSTLNVTNSTLNIIDSTVNNTDTTNNYDNSVNNYNSTTVNNHYGTTNHFGDLILQGNYYQPSYTFASWTTNIDNLDLSLVGNVRLRIATDEHFRRINSIIPGVITAGRAICFHNVGNFIILVVNEDLATAIANRRIATSTGNYYWLAPGHCVWLVYDVITLRWRVSENTDERLGSVKDYTPSAVSINNWPIEPQHEVHRISSTIPINLTGIKFGQPGLRHRLINHGTSIITLKHQNVGSDAENRFDLPGAADLKLHPGMALEVVYDWTSLRWRVLAYRDIHTERQIVYGANTTGIPTTTEDFTRQGEGWIRQTADVNGDVVFPHLQHIRRRAGGDNLTGGEVVAMWSGYGQLGDADEVLAYIRMLYSGTGSQVQGTIECFARDGALDNLAWTVNPSGGVVVELADDPNVLVGTDGLSQLMNVTVGAGLSLVAGNLSATGGTIIVREADGAPSVITAVAECDQATGLRVINVAGAGRITLQPAAPSQAGGLTSASQSVGGLKSFEIGTDGSVGVRVVGGNVDVASAGFMCLAPIHYATGSYTEDVVFQQRPAEPFGISVGYWMNPGGGIYNMEAGFVQAAVHVSHIVGSTAPGNVDMFVFGTPAAGTQNEYTTLALDSAGVSISSTLAPTTTRYACRGLPGASGTSGGGDTVTGGIITALGSPGGGDLSYTHTQGSPSTTWTVNHNLGKRPVVAVVDSGENVVSGEVAYVDDNTLTLSFAAAFGGKAYLS